MSLLRFSTAGSVDDGKSTLIGRLLCDSNGVFEDQLASVEKASRGRPAGIDLALITDGLRAEREQGITIDVAYRYFTTANRKFIVADTPGHEQYTRNMATGASTADLALILVDARHGVLPQSRRHAFIANLLGIRHFVIAVNKMDLVNFDASVYEAIQTEFSSWLSRIGAPAAQFIPTCARDGDNVAARSARMAWYTGPALLEHLETVPVDDLRRKLPARFPVQRVARTDDFRGYAGQITSGSFCVGDSVLVLPSDLPSTITRIATYDGDLPSATAPASVTLCLADQIDASRGDMIASADHPPQTGRHFRAHCVWMNARPLLPGNSYLLKHTTRSVRCAVEAIDCRTDMTTLERETADQLNLNGIGEIRLRTRQNLFFDPYTSDRATGAFILIDLDSHETVGAGIIIGAAAD